MLLVVTASVTAYGSVAIAALSKQDGPGDPVIFLQTVVTQIAANDYRKAWQLLDPAQQRLLPEEQYVACESTSPIPGHLTSLEVTGVNQQLIRVAGRNAAIESQAITFRIQISEPVLRSAVVITHTAHAIEVDDHWAWILPANRLQLDRSPACAPR